MSRSVLCVASKAVRLNLLTREPDGELAWTECIRALCASDRFRQQVDVFDGFALRERLEKMTPGSREDVPDNVWAAFNEDIRKQTVFIPAVNQSPECLAMFRGITEAPVSEKK